MAKNFEPEQSSINLIGAGTVIKGDITSNGDIRIDGTLTGSIHSKGKLVVGPSGSIEGEITCQNADFSGNIKAQVTVSELLSLKASAKLTGDVKTNKLSIEPGALFTCKCSMNNEVVDAQKVGTQSETVKNELQKSKQPLA